MSKNKQSLSEALGAHHPCPTQTLALKVEENENEQEATVDACQTLTAAVAKALASDSKEKTKDNEESNKKIPSSPSVFDDAANEQTLTASSVSGDHIPVDSSQPSSEEKAKGGWKKDPRPAVAVPGLNSDSDDIETIDHEQLGQETPPGMASDTESAAASQEGTRQAAIGAHAINERGYWTERQVHVDERRDSCTGKKQRKRASEDAVAHANEIKIQADDGPASSSETQDAPDSFGDEPTSDQRLPACAAPRATPGAVAVPGINSDNDNINHEHPSREIFPGMASDIECTAAAPEETPQAPIGAHVVDERGHGTGNARITATDERTRDHLLANALLVSASAVQDSPENPDAAPITQKCFPRDYSRQTWAMLCLLIAIGAAAATLMGVLIPRGSTADSQDRIQGLGQPNAASSSIPTTSPSLPLSLPPTFDPSTLRLRSIQSILVPITGLQTLSDTSTPQYRALEWVSLLDPLRLPYNTEADWKRVVQRYVLAVLYYSCGGEYWYSSAHFLEGIHECDWWDSRELSGKGHGRGALCTQGREVGEVDYLLMYSNNLTGALPSELQHLTNLKELTISGNKKLSGPIPGSIGNLTSLKRLYLYGNSVTGPVPKSLGNLTRLEHLHLSHNILNGTIPSALGRLSRLATLYLHGNRLSGSVPKSLGNLTILSLLDLSDNMLNCTISSVLGQLSSLGFISLDGNSFSGKIPLELCRRKEEEPGYFSLNVDPLTVNGTEFSCECIPVEGISGCCVVRPNKVGDGSCEEDEPYNTAACGWDGGDCVVKGLPECIGVNPSRIGDGYCDVLKPYNTEACGYDGGDCCESTCEGSDCGKNGYNCAACPEGTFPVAGKNISTCCVFEPVFVGDGLCNDGHDIWEPYNSAACGWDGGDCCEETCEGSDCGFFAYNCKDPTYTQHR